MTAAKVQGACQFHVARPPVKADRFWRLGTCQHNAQSLRSPNYKIVITVAEAIRILCNCTAATCTR